MSRFRCVGTVVAAWVLSAGGGVFAATVRVPEDYSTIQAAIDAVSDGDRVLVADGTYRGAGNRDLDFHGKPIRVVSENGAENCIIDCEGSAADPHRGFYFHSGETADAEIKGLTITGGDGVVYGGAIRCRNGSSPTIRRCIIIDNRARQGSGISCQEDANPTIIRCTITRGRTGHIRQEGGGIYCTGSRATIIECAIVSNAVEQQGGGIYCSDGSQLIIQDSTIAHCGASWGKGGGISSSRSVIRMTDCTIEGCWAGESGGMSGGVHAEGSTLVFTRCTIAENHSDGGSGGVRASGAVFTDCVIRDNRGGEDGGGVWGNSTFTNCMITGNSGENGGGVYGSGSVFTDCLIADNRSFTEHGGVTGGTFVNCTIARNTADNPVPLDGMFVNCIYRGNNESLAGAATYSNVEGGHAGEGNIDVNPRFVDPDGRDYRLAPGSPCIDAGDNTAVPEEVVTDLDGNPRFADDPDIEDTGNGEPPVVDMGPYEFQGASCPADLDDSGFVDVADILAVLSAWGPCNGCREDLDGSGVVDFEDVLIVVAAWGLCP